MHTLAFRPPRHASPNPFPPRGLLKKTNQRKQAIVLQMNWITIDEGDLGYWGGWRPFPPKRYSSRKFHPIWELEGCLFEASIVRDELIHLIGRLGTTINTFRGEGLRVGKFLLVFGISYTFRSSPEVHQSRLGGPDLLGQRFTSRQWDDHLSIFFDSRNISWKIDNWPLLGLFSATSSRYWQIIREVFKNTLRMKKGRKNSYMMGWNMNTKKKTWKNTKKTTWKSIKTKTWRVNMMDRRNMCKVIN